MGFENFDPGGLSLEGEDEEKEETEGYDPYNSAEGTKESEDDDEIHSEFDP